MRHPKSKPKSAGPSAPERADRAISLDLDLPVDPDAGGEVPPVPHDAMRRLCEKYLPYITSRPGFWDDRTIPPDFPRFRLD